MIGGGHRLCFIVKTKAGQTAKGGSDLISFLELKSRIRQLLLIMTIRQTNPSDHIDNLLQRTRAASGSEGNTAGLD
jgi:hypothetical protein